MVPKLIAPLFIELNGKKQRLDMNKYRNWHYRLSNNLKKYYQSLFIELRKYKFDKINRLEFHFYSNRKGVDLSNVCSIHDKFFTDCLVNYGCIKDDTVEYIQEVRNIFKGYDKINPRVEIFIYSDDT